MCVSVYLLACQGGAYVECILEILPPGHREKGSGQTQSQQSRDIIDKEEALGRARFKGQRGGWLYRIVT